MSLIGVHDAEGWRELVLDDGKVNALSQALLDELNQQVQRAAQDGLGLLISGRDGCFSAGFDLRVMRVEGEQKKRLRAAGGLLTRQLLSHPAPVVMACSGHAMAKGAFLLLCADWRVGSLGDFRICLNETAIGMPMPEPALTLARERLAPTWLSRAVLQAEPFDPRQALAAGFFDQLSAPDALLDNARTAMARLAALDRPAYAETRRRLNRDLLGRLE
ncbi:crotonase/enoyl-CoA hydratase family protein [Pseudomonas mangrovi]|uniref:Crotonase/enoyl-CoA hydratase family protein n=1 Tax=Pseudomonas mangrovi TaxID=2161748 RepID=A0A2T5P9G8_9PSED|nr:crotonase/enoyl-CoA hydratase family protein [Pseudomonas mangrovi]PTU74341.1 crotonase/enoyl-CoA hydratase family protein [Pseudomonas mangrovi]